MPLKTQASKDDTVRDLIHHLKDVRVGNTEDSAMDDLAHALVSKWEPNNVHNISPKK